MLYYKYEASKCRVACYDGVALAGECVYHPDASGWVIDHTQVDPAYGGRGIAGELLCRLVRQARIRRVCLTPVCAYARRTFAKNPAYAALMPGSADLTPAAEAPQPSCSLPRSRQTARPGGSRTAQPSATAGAILAQASGRSPAAKQDREPASQGSLLIASSVIGNPGGV
jgi:predicted GNAT family acetyltransferase